MEHTHVEVSHLQRPPYSSEDSNYPIAQPLYTGACFCGAVVFTVSRQAPLDARFCHCTTCQTLHAAPFQWAAIFEKTDVRFVQGTAELVYWSSRKKSGEYSLPCKVSCRRCRTPLMDEGRRMLMLFPSLIKLGTAERREKFYPSCHMFYGQRVVDVKDGKPKFSGRKGESKLLPETSESSMGTTER
ncbi:putative glutathione-dependent formaldehyde-activating enzyme [Lyophyllum shimeji]|uniref:Glutathione-dependent formaldehyde-activating enzyme n=1 Tax=Lyophyllum shimeji TaxID=47721 RepID=A0A9P3Q029_LYOSH|nr:putative glutathione-dependent formaldehyde-activating enzyme [Lyophyllum shimeji]